MLYGDRDIDFLCRLSKSIRASAGSNATNPILFEPMMVSAVVALQKKLDVLEYRLMDAIWRQVCRQQPLGDEGQAIKSETAT